MNQNWEKAYYYDEAHDLTYINQDRLTDEDRRSLIQIIGFSLEWNEDDRCYELEEVRYQEGFLFEESFQTVQDAFNRLAAYFDETLYEWVTDATYPMIWNDHQAALT